LLVGDPQLAAMHIQRIFVFWLAQLVTACDAEVVVEDPNAGDAGGDDGGAAAGSSSSAGLDVPPGAEVGDGAPAPSCFVPNAGLLSPQCQEQAGLDASIDAEAFAYGLVGNWLCGTPSFDHTTHGSGVAFQPGGRYQLIVRDDDELSDDVMCETDAASIGSWYVDVAPPGAPGPLRLVIETDTGVWSAHYPAFAGGGTRLIVDAGDPALLRQ